ncbi:MAG TPA: murein biosynthesis integral membrane protein MurJ, partial [Humisphaera sp.]
MSTPQAFSRDTPTAKVAVGTAATFLKHAKVVGLLTLVSRVTGLVREIVSAHYLGTGLVASAFTVAFTIPNLFRKLFGEGALSAAFIPLYIKAVRAEREAEERRLSGDGMAVDGNGTAPDVAHARRDPAAPPGDDVPPFAGPGSANLFAAAGVNLLVSILLGITVVGELGLFAAMAFWPGLRADHLLTLRLTAIMLPYVLLICGTAFLSGVLQVHKRFAAPAAAPVLLNLCHIAVLVLGATALGLGAASGGDRDAVTARQTTLVYWLAVAVLAAGGLQVAVLTPGLRAVGFRFRLAVGLWTPMTRQMLKLTVPVALGAGVVQLSVLLDRGISTLFMQGVGPAGELITHATVFGQSVRYPMEAGAPARLAVAQFMYLFPLGIFATALATAIFPSLSADALERDRTAFKASLRQGLEAALWEGIPASAGLILVCRPAVKLLFRHGQITDHDAELISRSLAVYAAAIWAFSLLQIASRAFYAVHDMRTPLVMSVVNLAINLAVELPLIWWMGEA